MSRQLGVILVLILLLASSCTPQSVVMPTSVTLTPAVGLANPASVFCQKQGFRLELRTDATGSQTGICHFPDGSQCDEWAYYRGECGPAGQADAGTTPAPSPTRVASPTAVPLPATASATAPAAGAIPYTSAALGISFSYLPEQNGQTVKVLEQGDKIYVYPANMEPTAGQWVQVFQKPAGESLLAAITRVIMPGYPSQDCQVRQDDGSTQCRRPGVQLRIRGDRRATRPRRGRRGGPASVADMPSALHCGGWHRLLSVRRAAPQQVPVPQHRPVCDPGWRSSGLAGDDQFQIAQMAQGGRQAAGP